MKLQMFQQQMISMLNYHMQRNLKETPWRKPISEIENQDFIDQMFGLVCILERAYHDSDKKSLNESCAKIANYAALVMYNTEEHK
jgi:hypothetical protein